MTWLGEQLGGFRGKRILELGPLEAGHTYLMAKAGAGHITSIEANSRAFMKCLIVQNALGFKADFKLGDFQKYLATCKEQYDFVLASGVLYHMTEPLELLEAMARVTTSIGLWTHYYDAEAIAETHAKASSSFVKKLLRPRKFDPVPRVQEFHGVRIESHSQNYGRSLGWAGFCGGPEKSSRWLTKESLFTAFEVLGFKVTVGHDIRDHQHGPCMLLYATR